MADNTSGFQQFVNKELPSRIQTDIPETGNLEKGLVAVSTGKGLGVEFMNFSDSIPQTKSIASIGTLEALKGITRWYPKSDLQIFSVRAYCGAPSRGEEILAALNINGVQSVLVTIPAEENLTEIADLNVQVTKDSYLTLDILKVGTLIPGSDLVVELYYKVIS